MVHRRLNQPQVPGLRQPLQVLCKDQSTVRRPNIPPIEQKRRTNESWQVLMVLSALAFCGCEDPDAEYLAALGRLSDRIGCDLDHNGRQYILLNLDTLPGYGRPEVWAVITRCDDESITRRIYLPGTWHCKELLRAIDRPRN